MTAPPATCGTSNKRILGYGTTSTTLALLSNRQLGRLLDYWHGSEAVRHRLEIIARYAPVAVALNDFYWSLYGESRTTPYPTADVERVCAETGFTPIVVSVD